MSRNLTKDNCDCGYVFGIKDFVGQPVEFRKYFDYAPQMGSKLVCPECDTVYFGYIRTGFDYWGDNKERAFEDNYSINGHNWDNDQKGKFVKKTTSLGGHERIESLGYYQIDLSYYESYNDEGVGTDECDTPAFLCTEDDERTRWYQTDEGEEEGFLGGM
jgi:hypothetical protein